MSGVTVATITRSMSLGSTPAISSALRAGRQREIRHRLGVGRDAPLADPVRSRIHSSFVSTSPPARRSSTTRSGTWQPRPVIEIGRPFARLIIRPPRRSAFRARPAREPTVARTLPLPIGPRTLSTSQTRSSTVPGRTIRLKRTPSIPAKSTSLPLFSGWREHGHRAALRERLDHLHAGHDRVAREMPGAVRLGDRAGARRRVLRARARCTSSTSRNGSRCGRICSISALPSSRSCAKAARAAARGRGGRSTSRSRRAGRSRPRSRRSRGRRRPSARRRWPARAAARQGSGRARGASPRRRPRVTGSPSRAARSSSTSGSVRRACFACAKSLHVLTTSRCSQVENCDSPRNWRTRTTSFASESCAASRASSGSRSRCSASFSTRGACRSQSAASACASPSFARVTRIGSESLS